MSPEDKAKYRKEAENGKKWCYDCANFYHGGLFCGYDPCMCKKYGSLDCDQEERHPDYTADTCPDYQPNGRNLWFEDK